MSLTMKDIAEQAHVSRQVVSAVLGGKSTCRVSAEKRALILDLVSKLHYRPNLQASCLRSGRKPEVGIFLPAWGSVLILKLVYGLNREARRLGLPLTYDFGMKREAYESFLDPMIRHRHPGIISYVPFLDELSDAAGFADLLNRYLSEGGHIINVNLRSWPMPQSCSVRIDEYEGGRLAAEYLRSRSCGSYVGLTVDKGLLEDRCLGFSSHLPSAPRLVVLSSRELDSSLHRAVRELTSTARKPVGVFCMNEDLCVFLSAFWEAGWQLGRDWHLVSYEDGTALSPRLPFARIVQPFEDLGVTAIRQLAGLLGHAPMDVEDHVLKPCLIG